MADFKVELLAELIMSGAYDQIKQLESQPVHLQVELDGLKEQTAEFKRLTKALEDYQKLSKQRQSLPVGFDQKQINQITDAFERLEQSIKDISTAIGTIDNASGALSLLDTIKSISEELRGVKQEFSSLSSAMGDLKLDFKIDLGGSKSNPVSNAKAFGDFARNTALPQIRDQIRAYSAEIQKYIGNANNDANALYNMIRIGELRRPDVIGKGTSDFVLSQLDDLAPNSALTKQIETNTLLLVEAQKAASALGIDLSTVDARFASSAEDLKNRAFDIKNGVQQANDEVEKLKNIFGGINANEASALLQPISENITEIVAKLGRVEETITQLSTGGNLADLTTAFTNVSESLRQIVTDCNLVRTAMNNLSGSSTTGFAGTLERLQLNTEAVALHESRIRGALGGIGVDTGDIDNIVDGLRQMDIQIKQITTYTRGDSRFSIVIDGLDDNNNKLQRTIDYTRTLNKQTKAYQWSGKVSEKTVQTFGATVPTENEVDEAYKRMRQLQTKIKSLNTGLIGKDTDADSRYIDATVQQINEAYDEYDRLDRQYHDRLNSRQQRYLAQRERDNADAVARAGAHARDMQNQAVQKEEAAQQKAAQRSYENAYKDIEADSYRVEQSLKGIQVQTEATKKAYSDYSKALQAMRNVDSSTDATSKIEATKQYEEALRNVNLQIHKNADDEAEQRQEANRGYEQMKQYLTERNKLLKKKASVKDGDDTTELDKAIAENDAKYWELRRDHYNQLDKDQRAYIARREKQGETESRLSKEAIENTERRRKAEKELADDQKATEKYNKTKSGIDKDKYDVESKIKNIKQQTEETRKAYAAYIAAMQAMEASPDGMNTESKIQNVRAYEDALSNLELQIRKNTDAEKASNKGAKLELDKSAFSSSIDVWATKNSKAADHFKDKLDSIRIRLKDCDATELTNLRVEFTDLKRQADAAGLSAKSFGDQIKSQFEKVTAFFTLDMIVDRAVDALRDMYQQVVEIDTSMTDLLKVTDESAARYEKFMGSASNSSKELGRSMSSYITQTAEWSKMGYGLDQAAELSKLSSIYSNVGEVSDETAVSDMVTAMKAYNIEASEAITIVDSLNKLGNEFAVTAAGLGSGMANSASAMATAGVSFEQTMAMITGIAEITQSPDEAGSFLKVASMRIRGMKGELEELGEEVDSSVDSISKVQTQILNLTSGKVNIFDQNGEFRNYYEIMRDIADVYNDLSSTAQATLTEILFGKMRGNQGAAMLQAFQSGQVQKALEAALNSSGSAMAEQAKWMESLEARIGKLKASWQSLSETFMSSDFLKGLMDFGIGFMDTIEGVIENIGVIPTILTAVTAGLSLKDVGERIKQFHYAITLANEYAHEAA